MSYQKLTHIDGKDEVAAHEKEYGRYNDSLPNLIEITAEEFAQSGFFTWCLQAYETRQILPENLANAKLLTPIKTYLGAQIFYFGSPNEDGFVMANDYWAKSMRYFKFAKCHHEYEEVSGASLGRPQWNCYHYYKCKKCGNINEVDSSG